MNRKEAFAVGISGLLANKLRAALTMLGIVFGVAAVIAMMSIGEGAKQETLQQIELLGTNNIIINKVDLSESKISSQPTYSTGLTMKDRESIIKINPYVVSVTPVRELQLPVLYKSNLTEFKVIGTTPDYPETFNTKMIEGTFFKNFQMEATANVCVIGTGIRDKLFRFENPLNKKIKIGDLWFDIVGVAAPKNVSASGMQSLGLRNFNDDIYIPLATMTAKMEKSQKNKNENQGRFNSNEEVINLPDRYTIDQLTVKVINAEVLKEAAELVKRILVRKHFGVRDYEIILPEQLIEQKQKTQRIFNIVMGAIAGISLLVGGIGIMNIMLANILERTKEIGVRRAIGATKIDILSQFIIEAVTISVLGGIIGIIVGFLLTTLISTYAEWKTVISTISVILAFFVSVVTGLIFGIYPAKKAADKNPIDCLRYE